MTSFTLETWFRRDGAGVGVTTGTGGIALAIPLVTKAAGEGEGPPNTHQCQLLPGHRRHAAASWWPTTRSPPGPTTRSAAYAVVTSNVWHHAAVTYDATNGTWKLYLDGVLDRTLVLASAFQPKRASLSTPPSAHR